jgi:hypothetical protein
MGLSIASFLRLAAESELIPPSASAEYASRFAHAHPQEAENTARFAQWIVAQGVLNRYQAKLLLTGRKGPFQFGEFTLVDKLESGPLAGLFRAAEAGNPRPVCLKFLQGVDAAQPATLLQAVDGALALAAAHPALLSFRGQVDLGTYKFLVFEDLGVAATTAPTLRCGPSASAAPAAQTPEPIPSIRTATSVGRGARSRRPALPFAVLALAACGAIVAWFAWPPEAIIQAPVAPQRAALQPTRQAPETQAPSPSRPGETGLRALGEPLWESPTAGPPLDVRYLPAGVQAIVALRLAELARHAEWLRLVDPRVSGVSGAWLNEGLPAICGRPLSDVERVLVGVLPVANSAPRWIYVVTYTTPRESADLLAAWGNPGALVSDASGSVWRNATRVFVQPEQEANTVAIVIDLGDAAPEAVIAEVMAAGLAPAPLRREFEHLLLSSDAERLVSVLVAPDFLAGEGSEWFTAEASRLRGAIVDLLAGPASTAPPGASHDARPTLLDDHLFLELRVHETTTRPGSRLASELRSRLDELPAEVDAHVRGLALSPYSYDILWAFPKMVDAAVQYSRVASTEAQAVVRLILPSPAAHNLVLGTRLALLEPPRSPHQPAAAGDEPPAEASAAERLQRRLSLAFPRNTLEQAIDLVSREIGQPIEILGRDLQLAGITRNQSFSFEERDQPAAEVLQKLLSRASPDGKLVYVVRPATADAGEVVVITTRAAAIARGETISGEVPGGP